MREMAREEVNSLEKETEALQERLRLMLLPKDPRDEKNVIMEIRAGAGGEALPRDRVEGSYQQDYLTPVSLPSTPRHLQCNHLSHPHWEHFGMISSRTFRSLSALTLLASAFVVTACNQAAPEAESEDQLVERARGIHERVITMDTHDDISPANFTAERNYTTDLGNQVNLPKMEAGGLDVAWFVVYVGQGELNEAAYAEATAGALEHFEAIHRLAEEFAPDRIEIAYNSDDVRRIAASGKKVAMIGIENSYQLGTDLGNIERFHDLGGRSISLSHNGHSQYSDSNTGERDDVWLHNGLSDLGREAIAEINRVGMMIDVSHPSKAAMLEMVELSQAPLIASHSSARALNDVSRNLDDDQLILMAENGGVVQTVAFASYVDSEKSGARRQAQDEALAGVAEEMGFEMLPRRQVYGLPEAERVAYMAGMQEVRDAAVDLMAEVDAAAPAVDVADFVDHIDYLVDLIGIDHVGISSDFDGGGGVEGWSDASETFNVTLELVRREYSEEDIAKLWSGNLLRVLDEVQAVAAEIQAEG
jgi:membrane dipeptidase